MKINDFIKTNKGAIGCVVLMFGNPPKEIYADMIPGADAGYEYITMFDKDTGTVELRALNKYSIKDVTIIKKNEINKILNIGSNKWN